MNGIDESLSPPSGGQLGGRDVPTGPGIGTSTPDEVPGLSNIDAVGGGTPVPQIHQGPGLW